jgi:hypothetical protein
MCFGLLKKNPHLLQCSATLIPFLEPFLENIGSQKEPSQLSKGRHCIFVLFKDDFSMFDAVW